MLVANWESGVGYAWWLMENFWCQIAQHFEKRGFQVLLVYPKITSVPEKIQSSKIRLLEIDYNDSSLNGWINLTKIIRENRVDVIYLTDKPFFDKRYAIFHLLGVKNVIIHDHTPGERMKATGIKRIIKHFMNRLPYFPADHLFAVTDYVQERFLQTYCWPSEKCSVVPNGIMPYQLKSELRGYAYELFEIPRDSVLVVSTGRAIKYKRINFVLNCANELVKNRRNSNIYFIYCGDGPDFNELKELSEQLSLGCHFIFAGNRSDIPEILQSASFGLHSSKGEVGYSLSILEFMSAGLVTLVPDNSSVSGSIQNGQNGYVYTEGNIEEVADIIEESICDLSKSNVIRENAIESVKERFNLLKTNELLVSCMEKLIEK